MFHINFSHFVFHTVYFSHLVLHTFSTIYNVSYEMNLLFVRRWIGVQVRRHNTFSKMSGARVALDRLTREDVSDYKLITEEVVR
jgi:hypothetical protein